MNEDGLTVKDCLQRKSHKYSETGLEQEKQNDQQQCCEWSHVQHHQNGHDEQEFLQFLELKL